MRIKDIKQLISNVNKKELHIPILLIGATGIGKSCLVKQICKELGIGYVDLRPATQETTDLIGIPRGKEITYGELRKLKTFWSEPEWWPQEGTKGILALEEVNRAPEDVKQALFQIVTEWRMHTHILPKGWSIVAIINPDNGNYHVSQLDPAFKRRFVQIIVEPDVQDWISWAKMEKLHEDILSFIQLFPKDLYIGEDIKIDAKPTPAGYHMLSILLNAQVIPPNCEHEIASGILGTTIGTKFITTRDKNFERFIKGIEILNNYSKVKDKYIKITRQDLLYATMLDVVAECESNPKLNNEQLKNLKDYLLDSNPEIRVTVLSRLVNNSVNGKSEIIEKLSNFDDLVDDIIKLRKEVE